MATIIQRYTNGTIGFDFATEQEKRYYVASSIGGAGQVSEDFRILLCVGHGEVRYVAENTEHIDGGYCTVGTWTEVADIYGNPKEGEPNPYQLPAEWEARVAAYDSPIHEAERQAALAAM